MRVDGVSLVVCVGKFAWPQFQMNMYFSRLVIGPIAIWLILRDFDVAMGLVNDLREREDAERGDE